MAQCTTTALAGAMPRPCVRGARGRFRGLRPVPGVVSPLLPPSRPACPALRVAGRPVWVSLTLARWYAIPHGLCVPRARSGCPSGSPRVPLACVCARAPAASAPAPPLGCVVCALRAVPALGAGRAVPRGPCPSACPAPVPCSAGVPWGGGGPVPVPPYLAWGCAPPSGRVRGVRVPGGGLGGGGACAVPPVCAGGGASRAGGRFASFRPSAFPGQATNRSSLASFWSSGAGSPYRSSSCSPAFSGRDLCGVLAHWRGLTCSPRFLWDPAAGAGGRAVLLLLSRAGGGGALPPASGGWGLVPPRLAGRWGGFGGGGVPPRPPALPLGGGPRFPTLAPLLSSAQSLPAGAFGPGPGAAPGGGDEGRPVDRSPGGPLRPEPSLCPPRVGNGHGGGHGGRSPILLWCAAVCHPQVWSARHSGALVWARPSAVTPAGAGGWGRWGTRFAGPAASPPAASRSLPGEGGRPLGSGGAEGRSCGPQAGGGSRGGVGGPLRRPPPLRPVGRRPAICCLRRIPPGYTLALGVAGRPWASGAARSAANGSVRRGREGGGGGGLALVRAPAFPRPASEGAALFAPSWAPPVCRRPAAGRAGACGRFTGGACRGSGAPSPRVQRPLRRECGAAVSSVCLRPLFGLRGRGGGVGGALWSPGAAP